MSAFQAPPPPAYMPTHASAPTQVSAADWRRKMYAARLEQQAAARELYIWQAVHVVAMSTLWGSIVGGAVVAGYKLWEVLK